MFTVSKEATFTHDVEVFVPVDGGHEKQSFKATFAVVDVEMMEDTGTLEGQQALLRETIRSFSEVVDDNKKEIPYSDELRDQFIKVPYIRAGLIRTYLAAVSKSREGN